MDYEKLEKLFVDNPGGVQVEQINSLIADFLK